VETPELTQPVLIAIGVGLLVAGLIIGLLLGRRSSPAGQKSREVERQLDEVLQAKKVYEDEVVEHFTATAKLLNNLTESYREVHNHLATGAGTLCKGEGPVSLGRLENGQEDPNEIPPQLASIQPPLDYAPKTSPDEKGMLNEEFGIERKPVQAEKPAAESKA
tara:strand:+ start:246647 stop:247135 length:489 start_codon:yes stop_codon:yes gene_type:complete